MISTHNNLDGLFHDKLSTFKLFITLLTLVNLSHSKFQIIRKIHVQSCFQLILFIDINVLHKT